MDDSQNLTAKENESYVASAYLEGLIRDLKEQNLLQGKVREAVIGTLKLFRQRRVDPQKAWHSDFCDLYEELVGDPSEIPEDY